MAEGLGRVRERRDEPAPRPGGQIWSPHRGEGRREAAPRHLRPLAIDLQLVEAVLVLYDPQRPVAELRLDVLLPEVGGLEDVAVGVDGAVPGQAVRLVHGRGYSWPVTSRLAERFIWCSKNAS